ncbi:Protein translocase subunit SecD [uncultured Desulfatiglans sp.]|nr:Protein translocase subunit SecD [uncultured Desulfatiglans sp.]
MSKSLSWRSALAGLVLLAALIYLTPSLTSTLPDWWSRVLPDDRIRLGLDLQGGIHLVLEVEVDKAVESHLERTVEELKGDLRKEKLRYQAIERTGLDGIEVMMMRAEDVQTFRDTVGMIYSDFDIKTGGEEDGHPVMLLMLQANARKRIKEMAVDQALETIRNRIDQFGVTEPEIRPQEDHRILVQLPGVSDPKRAIELIGKTALLEFKLVDEDHSLDEALEGNIPPGSEILYESPPATGSPDRRRIPYLLKKRAVLTGEYITDARVAIDSQYNEPYVSLSFDTRGARLFEQITGENIKKRLAIVLDNNVYSAPVIQDKIAGGKAQITGRFTMDEAKDLAIVLRAGALPAPVKILEERTVGPSLGMDSIQKGIKSMLIGGLIVILFMAIYYNLSGLIADLALVLNMIFIMAGLSFFGATLTLPGIAGIILTIGMSVDANVLIFERIREESRLGKTPRAAIEAGYGKALVTILDAQVTTLIGALILFQFGTGPVRGFAVTLSIGIVASLFTAIFVTRIIFDLLYVQKRMKKLSI